MSNLLTNATFATMVIPAIIFRLGIFRTMYWFILMFKQCVLDRISWPQPNVTRHGKYNIVSFMFKGHRCKLVFKEAPYIIDIMEDDETSVKELYQPFFQISPINFYRHDHGKKFMLSTLNNKHQIPVIIPQEILS